MDVDTAVVLAAGQGRRLLPLTSTIPKSLISIADTTIIDHILNILSHLGIEYVAIVVGYKGDAIRRRIGMHYRGLQIAYLDNPLYEYTDNISSLWYAQGFFYSDILLIEGDVFMDGAILQDLLVCPHRNAVVVDRFDPEYMSGPVVSLNNAGLVDRMILDQMIADQNPDPATVYKTVNAYKLSFGFLRKQLMPLLNLNFNLGLTDYNYGVMIRDLILEGVVKFAPVMAGQRRWVDINTPQDLERALQMFSSGPNLVGIKK